MADAIDPNDETSRADGAARREGEEEVSRAREREERLTELTDQSLDLLDQLAEARRRVAGLEEAVRDAGDRRARLEDLLADARRRVRSTRSLRGLGSTAGTVPVDVVLWTLSERLDPAWLERARAALAAWTTTVLAPPTDATQDLTRTEGVRVLAADGRTPAHLANLALASTDAPLVLLVLAGTDVDQVAAALDAGAFAAADDETVALAQPALVHDDGDATLGLEETRALRVRRRPLEGDASGPVVLDAVAPEVVLVRRAAFERLGPFDEDLCGEYAFVEYALRAVARDLQVVGLPDVRVGVPARALPGARRDRVRDRLVTLAQHRRGELGAGLGGEELYWQLDPPELRALIAALLRRIPGAAEWPEAVERLTEEAVGLAGRTISGPALDARLEELELRLDALDAVPGEPPTAEESSLREGADEVRGSDPASRLYRVARRLQVAAEAKEALAAAVAAARAAAERLEREAERVVAHELQEARDRSRAFEERARHHEVAAAAAQERAYSLHEQVADVRARLRAAHVELEHERDLRAEELAAAAARHRDELAEVAAALGLDCGPDVAAVLQHVGVLRETLQDRERWLASLLHETTRGWGGRRLRPHERAFLDGRGDAP